MPGVGGGGSMEIHRKPISSFLTQTETPLLCSLSCLQSLWDSRPHQGSGTCKAHSFIDTTNILEHLSVTHTHPYVREAEADT